MPELALVCWVAQIEALGEVAVVGQVQPAAVSEVDSQPSLGCHLLVAAEVVDKLPRHEGAVVPRGILVRPFQVEEGRVQHLVL